MKWNLESFIYLLDLWIFCGDLRWKNGILYLFIWFIRRRIWSMAILAMKSLKILWLSHCYNCNKIFLVIQWNEIWNLLFIWLWEGSDPWYGSEIFKWYHCYICSIIFQVIQCNLEYHTYLFDSWEEESDPWHGSEIFKWNITNHTIATFVADP